MIELFTNLFQLLIVLLATGLAGVLFYKSHIQAYLLLTCFYGTFMLGSLYWTLHFFLFDYTPQIFYVSELAWLTSHMFLLTLVFTLASPDERRFKHPAVWLAPLFCLPQLVIYWFTSDILLNTIISCLALAIMWQALRGFFYARNQSGKGRKSCYFHLVLIGIIVLEHGLWTSSCFWQGDTIANPYFWFDFLLSIVLILLLPATRKAVDHDLY